MPEISTIAAELDAAHLRARASYRAKDVSAYMGVFAPGLRYKQPDGRIVGRDQLARDVTSQLASVEAADTSYVRESLQIEGNGATEVLTQTASVTMRRFLFFKRIWRLTRRGRYTWVRFPDGWKIQEVDVLSESIGPGAP
jgi:hypothetical protein